MYIYQVKVVTISGTNWNQVSDVPVRCHEVYFRAIVGNSAAVRVGLATWDESAGGKFTAPANPAGETNTVDLVAAGAKSDRFQPSNQLAGIGEYLDLTNFYLQGTANDKVLAIYAIRVDYSARS